ncbi:MAG: FadR family transcriptional regulator [Phycisphaerales bacterium]|nr:FadR family transcriptional regulator [Phycisphaerales bacterium]
METKRRSGSTGRAVASATRRQLPVRTLQSQVVDGIGVGIIGGEFPPGTTLPTDAALQERFGVSRTVLREALKALAAKNLISSRARIGTVVLPRREWSLFDPDVLSWHFETGPDIAFLRSLAEIRIGLELESVALAAERRTDEQLALMRAHVDGMAAAGNTADFARSDLEFHRTVAEASGNPFMASITGLVDLVLATAFTISSPVDDGEARDVTVNHHRRVAEAIGARDAEGARAAMRVVIMEGFDRAAGRMSAA